MSNPNETVVISGVSGRLPESSTIEEFKKHLYAGTDLVTDDERRWPSGIHGLPARSGKLKDLSHFDASFFGIPAKQAHIMDPQSRILLEATFEAIIDAGMNPNDLKGTNAGVYIGCSMNEAFDYWNSDPEKINGYGLVGGCRAMIANRISFAFNFSGPSLAIDTACSSGMVAFTEAVDAIKAGKCDSAFVGGINLLLNPNHSLQYNKLGMLSSYGKCKSFDNSGEGYARSEAIVIIYLQKSSEAKRIYASVLGVGSSTDGKKEKGITFPSSEMQMKLMKRIYSNAGVDPKKVVYVEAHAAGTQAGDPQELNAIVEVFCGNEKRGLMIGTVKSNMGHSEATSGLCALVKVLLAMECGEIPANLHYETPNVNIPGLVDGRLKVLTKNQKWNGGLVAVNCFGFGGSNAHTIVKSNEKEKPPLTPTKNECPYLVTISGRNEDSIEYFLQKINDVPYNQEFYSLINNAHREDIQGHEFRGFSVIGSKEIKYCDKVNESKNPQVWYVFSGMGSQWPGMGKHLMAFEPFKKSIQKCAQVLKPYRIDLVDIITNEKPSVLDDLVHSFVAITSVQIALVDILNLLGVKPDGLMGHSAGEVACGYADNTTTLEETILTAYFRGKTLCDSDAQKGAMAAVALSWEECQKHLIENVEVVCNNGPNSVTISGLPEAVKKLTSKLSEQKIFAVDVNTSGYAFHSKYVAKVGPKLKQALEGVIPKPRKRSAKWVSTSIVEAQRNTPLDEYNSADYQVNNFVSPVRFYEATRCIPEGALVLELGPHSLLQAILKKSLVNVTNLGLMKRDDASIESFLSNIGRIYTFGKNINVAALYPQIKYPVSRGTPMISHMIKWDHSVEWTVPDYSQGKSSSSEYAVEVDLSNNEYAFLAGHIIDGRVLFPATGYIVLVWKAFAKMKNQNFEQLPVVFEDITFLRATIIPPKGSIKFSINIFQGTGDFEICESGDIVSTGKVSTPQSDEFLQLNQSKQQGTKLLTKSDIYKELRLKGFGHIGDFQKIKSADCDGNCGILEWENNWVTFMDTMAQFHFLPADTRNLRLPTGVRKILIDPKRHRALNTNEIPIYKKMDVMQAGGVELRGLKSSSVSKKSKSDKNLRLEKYEFVPFDSETTYEKNEVVCVVSQLVVENCPGVSKLKIAYVGNEPDENFLNEVKVAMEYEPFIRVDCFTVKPDKIVEIEGKHLVVAKNALAEKKGILLTKIVTTIKGNEFLLFEESREGDVKLDVLKYNSLELISKLFSFDKIYVLARKIQKVNYELNMIEITKDKFDWVEPLKKSLILSEIKKLKICIYSHDSTSGIIGLGKSIMREPGGENVKLFLIQDNSAAPFNPNNYSKIISKDLTQNVLKNGIWGTYKHLPLNTLNETHPKECAFVNVTTRGDLSSLNWIEGNLNFEKGNKNLCDVYCAALNFRDVMLATGKLNPDAIPGNLTDDDCMLGLEFSGRNVQGKRVMGIVSAKALATSVVCDPNFTWEVPSNWSLEQAATVPLVYATSYYSLIIRGKMKPGESILIHAGSGGVGQAAISISLHMGCKVFTTVSTDEKRTFLKEKFPKLKHENIGYSRDCSFEQWIMDETNGKGVDLVLNSLAGEQLKASLRCLAKNGRFLEIGKVDLSNNTALGMSVFLKNISVNGILLDMLFDMDCDEKTEVRRLLQEGIKSGAVQPLKNTVYPRDEIEEAFRFLASGRHIGKVSIKIREEENNPNSKAEPLIINALKKTHFNPDKVYVIIGGLGGFGLELTNWMISRGARKLILNSRSGVKTGYQTLCLKKWNLKNVQIQVLTEDITTSKGAEMFLEKSKKLGVIAGIFNLAGILKDAFMNNQTLEQFELVSKAKISTTKNLDSLSRIHAPDLEYFVVFSSIVSGRGNSGQANYALANSAMERICEERASKKLPALAIQWGPIGDVGMIGEEHSHIKELLGAPLQSINSCLSVLDKFIQQKNPVVASTVLSEKRESEKEKSSINLVSTIANILGIRDVKSVNQNHTLGDIGIDSLMGTEIKLALENNFDLSFSAQEIRALTFGRLKQLEEEKSGCSNTNIKTENSKENQKITNGINVEAVSANQTTKTNPVQNGHDSTEPKRVSKNKFKFIKMKESKNNKTDIFIFPPLEAIVDLLYNLAENINANVYGAEYQQLEFSSFLELANISVEELKAFKPNGPYKLVGYSFGAAVTLEMAVILEKNGDQVELLLIDGSAFFAKKTIGMVITTSTDERELVAEQIKGIIYYLKQHIEVDAQKLVKELTLAKTFTERINIAIRTMSSKTNVPAEKVKSTLHIIYKAGKLVLKYEPKSIYNGDLILIKSSDNFVSLAEDYGLKSMCTGKITIKTINGTHRSILDNPSLFKLVNEYYNLDKC